MIIVVGRSLRNWSMVVRGNTLRRWGLMIVELHVVAVVLRFVVRVWHNPSEEIQIMVTRKLALYLPSDLALTDRLNAVS